MSEWPVSRRVDVSTAVTRTSHINSRRIVVKMVVRCRFDGGASQFSATEELRLRRIFLLF